jgi:UDP-N-acetyl-D-glucosamine dehydrogenase
MPYHVVSLVASALNLQRQALKGAKVLVLGVAFKKNIDDARESPARRVIEGLFREGAEVTYNDPHIPRFSVGGDTMCPHQIVLASQPLDQATVAAQDCLVILAAHDAYDYPWLVQTARLIVDAVDATRGVNGRNGKVVRLGAPFAEGR